MKIFVSRDVRALFMTVAVAFAVFIAVCAASTAKIIPIVGAVILCAAVGALLYGFLLRRSKLLEDAEAKITEYIYGGHSARIECDGEGELNRLFHRVNTLSAVLDAHLDREQAQKLFLKDTIADISHQLKTPLAALNVYTGIMQGEPDNEDTVRRFSDLSERELERIETLVQSLLKITKLDSGTMRFSRRRVNIGELAEAVKKRFEYRLAEEGKEIILSGDGALTLLCDREWLTEALGNIVKNALDHTSRGGTICIEQRRAASSVQVIIRDDGSGIHPEDMPHIFKRFYRSRFSQDTAGIGLGLPLAKAIVEAHGGTIETTSELGRGGVFTLTFAPAPELTGQNTVDIPSLS